MPFALVVGDNLETANAETYDGAKTLAGKLARKYRDQVVVAIDTHSGTQAFTCTAPKNCAGCDD